MNDLNSPFERRIKVVDLFFASYLYSGQGIEKPALDI